MFKRLTINKNLIKSAFCFTAFFLFVAIVAAHPIYPFKFKGNTLNLAQITDVHLDSKTSGGKSQRMFESSQNLLKDAVSQVNNLKDIDLVVFSGDVVNRSDKNDFLKFINIAKGLKAPWYYAAGNHDVGIFGGLSKSDVKSLLNKNSSCLNCNKSDKYYTASSKHFYYRLFLNKNFLILFMDGVIDSEITANGYFPKEELEWLNNQLKNNPDKKTLIVQHFPVVEPFKSVSHVTRNADEYLKILDKYSNVIAVLSGHYHSTKIIQRKNVLHISSPALVEYPNAFRTIKITDLNDSTKFEIRLVETNLKEVQKLSKNRSSNSTLKEGQKCDRNAVIIIKNAQKAFVE